MGWVIFLPCKFKINLVNYFCYCKINHKWKYALRRASVGGLIKHMAKKQSLERKKQIKAQSAQRKAERAKEETAILNKCLSLLGVLVVAEIYFLLCYRFFVQGTMQSLVTMSKIIAVVEYVGLTAAVAGVIWALVRRRKTHAQGGVWLALLGAVLFVGGRLMLTIYPAGTTVMCAVVPLLALAGFVYYLYQREFFCCGLGLGLAIGGMWLAHRAEGTASWDSRYIAAEVVLLVLVLALLVLTVIIGRNDGKWGKGEKAVRIFSDTTNYAIAYGVLVIAAIVILAGIFASAAALYLMWAGIALLFVLAVYYTMHLM